MSALASLGAEGEMSQDGQSISAKTGWSLMSFNGERVKIDLDPQESSVNVTVTSKQSPGQLLDLGRRNQKNVASILDSMETRLRK